MFLLCQVSINLILQGVRDVDTCLRCFCFVKFLCINLAFEFLSHISYLGGLKNGDTTDFDRTDVFH